VAVETVRIYTIDELGGPLVGVLVRFFDGADVLVTQQYSALVGVEAYAEVSLDGDDPTPIDYTIRMSKTGVAFDGGLGDDSKTPQAISVYSPPGAVPPTSNGFTVRGQTFTRPVAPDPRLCRASGFFRDVSGCPLANLDLHFIGLCQNDEQPPMTPMIVDGDAVLQGGELVARTDSDGYFQIDLYRTGAYGVFMQGFETDLRAILVPDAPSVNLVHLLFPVVTEITFSPDPLTLNVDDVVDIDVTILATDGQTLDIDAGDVEFASSDTGIASVQIWDSKLRVVGVAVGTTEITAARADESIVVLPDEPTTYTPLSVIVS
jgi:hypothetical protein